MKKTLILAVAAVCTLTAAQAQKTYAKIVYKAEPVVTNEVNITVDNAVSTDKETKFKLKIKDN